MRVAVCADMEGISGIDGCEHCFPSWPAEYRRGVRLLVAEVRAAVRGAEEAGAAEVVLADWHYLGRNIPRAAFPDLPIRRLWSAGRPLVGTHGLGRPDAAVFVGMHAGAGNAQGFLSHTFWRGLAVLLEGRRCPRRCDGPWPWGRWTFPSRSWPETSVPGRRSGNSFPVSGPWP